LIRSGNLSTFWLILATHETEKSSMPAIDTFDWFKKQVWDQLTDDARRALDLQRDYMLTIRNENERRRFIEDLMKDVKQSIKRK
jgi:hypothetical protein